MSKLNAFSTLAQITAAITEAESKDWAVVPTTLRGLELGIKHGKVSAAFFDTSEWDVSNDTEVSVALREVEKITGESGCFVGWTGDEDEGEVKADFSANE